MVAEFAGGRVLKMPPEVGGDLRVQLAVGAGVPGTPQRLGCAGDGFGAQSPGGGGGQLGGREARRTRRLAVAVIIPVPQPGGGEAIPGLPPDEIGEAAHQVEVVFQDLPVAEPLVVLPGHQNRRRAPFHRPVERPGEAARRVAGGHGQDAPAGLLRVADVMGDLAEPVPAFVAVEEAGFQQVGALEPAEFFPVRAIGQHPAHIGAHRRVNELVRAVVEIAGAVKAPGLSQPGAHRHELQAANDRQIPRVGLALRHGARDFDELHAQVEEEPLMRVGLAVGDKVAVHDIAPEQPVFGIFVFAAAELDAVARLAAGHRDSQLGGGIPGERIEENARGWLPHRGRGFRRERLDARPEGGRELAGGGAGQPDGLPGMIIKARGIPSRLLEARVEVFPRVDVGEHHRAVRRAPGFIRAESAGRAAPGLETNFGAQQEGFTGRALRAVLVVAPRGRVGIVPERVAEHDSHAIGSAGQPGGDVELAIVKGLLVLRPGLVHARVGEPLAVDARVKVPQPRKAQPGAARRPVEDKLLAEPRAGLVGAHPRWRGNPARLIKLRRRGAGQGGERWRKEDFQPTECVSFHNRRVHSAGSEE